MSATDRAPPAPAGEAAALARRLGLPLAVLFGLSVTIGAGIYVLIGATGVVPFAIPSPKSQPPAGSLP